MTQPDLPETIVLADTATKLGPHAAGAVIVTGSHGGRYAAYLTLKAHPRAVIHNDAGVGKDDAGIAVIAMAEALGVAAATASHTSCRVGDTADMMVRGRISHVNAPARALGVAPGMTCRDAALCLVEARATSRDPEPCAETRRTLQQSGWHRRIVLMDSASLIAPEDAGQIIVTGSHGALVGGSAQMALRVDAFAAVFSDAGVGADDAGITRLPALDARGIAGVTVSAASARIGDAASIHADGIVSHANATALRLGARVGEPIASRLAQWVETP
jgi:uncharacterized protein YunC (DUF1805 family)